MKRMSAVLKELILGILICGVFFQSTLIWLAHDKVQYTTGLWIGIVCSVLKAVHMEYSIRNALERNEKGARNYARMMYGLRMALSIPSAIGNEVFVTYIGIGLPLDTPTLGNLIEAGRELMTIPFLRYQLYFPVAVLALTCVVYAAFCAAVVRAFFRARVNRTAYRAAGAWAACFGVTLVGSLMALDTRGVDAAATFAACACLLSFPSCLLLERRWRNRDMAAAVAYLQLHRPAPRPATPAAAPGSEWGTGLDATCARLARSYDLTRREEDVLRLLMEGRTFAEAADELVVSLNTVKSHVRRIYAKMGVNGKADLLEKVSSAI